MTQPSDPDGQPSLAACVGFGTLLGILVGPFLLVSRGAPTPLVQVYGLWTYVGAVLGGACSGGLFYATHDWPSRRPALARWRGVIIGAATAMILGVLAVIGGLSPVADLPMWGVAGGGVVALGQLGEWMRGGTDGSGHRRRPFTDSLTWFGFGVLLLLTAALAVTIAVIVARARQ